MISFIIPAKNEEKYISGCLLSIQNQAALIDHEIIVVDNGSCDRTADIVAGSFPGVKLVREQTPGTNPARQRGFLESHGDVVIFLDADVRLPDRWLEKIFRKFKSDPDIVALSAPYIFYDFPWYWRAANWLFMWLVIAPYSAIVMDWLGLGTQMVGGDMAIKRSALESVGGLDTTYSFFGDDTMTAKRLTRVGRVVFSPRYAVLSSARRYTEKGVVAMTIIYLVNYFWCMFTGHPYSKKYAEVVR